MTSGNGHGGRRSGTGRPRRGGGHRNNLLGTSSASLARKYAEEAVRTVVAIMRDEHDPHRLGSTPRGSFSIGATARRVTTPSRY